MVQTAVPSFRKEVVHALTSSSRFRDKAREKRLIIADADLPGRERLSQHRVVQREMGHLSVTRRHQASPRELQEAFLRLAGRSLKTI